MLRIVVLKWPVSTESERLLVADPIAEIRAELQRVKGWPESIAHVPNVLDRCMECSCRWPCTEAEAAQDAAKLANALERALAFIEEGEAAGWASSAHSYAGRAESALSDIAQLLREE